MTKYAKLINETTIKFPPKNKGGVMNYDTNIPLLIEDGYKELVEAEKEKGKSYQLTYKQTKTKIIETATEIEPPDPVIEREKEFDSDFFFTSLGYVRRLVTMENGEHKDFLSDLLPSIAIATSIGNRVPVLLYNKPDNFSEEIIDWTPYQHYEIANQLFIAECFNRLQNDFKPKN